MSEHISDHLICSDMQIIRICESVQDSADDNQVWY